MFRCLIRCLIRCLATVLLTSYLSNRSQYVNLNGIIEDIEHISFGIPQDSLLGSLIFSNINDMHNILKYSKSIICADDTNLNVSSKSLDILQKNIQDDIFSLIQIAI